MLNKYGKMVLPAALGFVLGMLVMLPGLTRNNNVDCIKYPIDITMNPKFNPVTTIHAPVTQRVFPSLYCITIPAKTPFDKPIVLFVQNEIVTDGVTYIKYSFDNVTKADWTDILGSNIKTDCSTIDFSQTTNTGVNL